MRSLSFRRPLLFAFRVCACASALSSPRRAAAQPPAPLPIEVYAGYSYLRDPENSILAVTADDNSFRVGWMAGGARRLSRHIAVVGEASGHYKTRTTFDEDVRLSFHAFLGGARASMAFGRFEEFAQALGGAVHASGSAFGLTASKTSLSLQPGGGVDCRLAGHVSARLQLDYRWIKGSDGGDPSGQFRASAAIVLR